MKAKKFQFKLGDKTRSVISGDLVTECEFLSDLGNGQMLFYDITLKCFRRVFIAADGGGTLYLNGFTCASRPSKLLMNKHDQIEKDKKLNTSICWWCKKPGANIRTEPQSPDNEAWWFHKDCYWKLQEVLYD